MSVVDTGRRLFSVENRVVLQLVKLRPDIRLTNEVNPGEEYERYGVGFHYSETRSDNEKPALIFAAGLAAVVPQGGLARISSTECTAGGVPFGGTVFIQVIHENDRK